MTTLRLILTFCLAFSFVPLRAEEPSPQPKVIGAAWIYTVTGEYEDVKADLVAAIESRGIVISYVAHAASML